MMDRIIPKFLLPDLEAKTNEITRIHDLEAAIGPVQYAPRDRQTQGQIIPQPQVQRRRLSEAAAAAAQQWEDLEAENHNLRIRLEASNAKTSVLEQSNLILHEELETCRIERDYHERRCIRLLTYIEQVGSLALSAAKDIEPEIIRHAVEAATQPKPEHRDETPIATEDRKVPLYPAEANPPRSEGESPTQ